MRNSSGGGAFGMVEAKLLHRRAYGGLVSLWTTPFIRRFL